MLSIILAILPIFMLIFLGSGLRRLKIFGEGFWPVAERLVYFVLFPPLLFTTLATADLGALAAGELALAMLVAISVLMAGLTLGRPLLGIPGPAFTSLAQGALRQNTYIGFSAAFALYGVQGFGVAAIWLAAVTPLVNVFCIAVLARHGTARRSGTLGVVFAVLRNPIILACAAGAAVNLAGLTVPPVVSDVLEILGRGSLPLGLLAIGAGLEFTAVKRGGRALPLAVVTKLVLLPLLMVAALKVFEIAGTGAAVSLLFASLPTAPSSYILARQLGGDAKLLAGIITVQTGCALITMPLILVLLT